MSAHFSFQVDPSRDFLRVRMVGMFTPAEIRRIDVERGRALARLHCAPNQHVTLSDMREMSIQSQESVEAFRTLIGNPAHASRRVAFVCAPSLLRSQLKRCLPPSGANARLFDDEETAEAWLMSRDDAVSAAA